MKNLDIHHVKGQLGSGGSAVNGAIPKRTAGIYFTVLDETTGVNSRFNDVLIDGCDINYVENQGIALDNEDNIYYPAADQLALWVWSCWNWNGVRSFAIVSRSIISKNCWKLYW